MIREYLRTLTVAALAVGVLVAPGLSSYGKNGHPSDDGIRCAYYDKRSGQWKYYLPDEHIVILDEHGSPTYLKCGYDGNWLLAKPTEETTDHGGGTSAHPMP